MAREKRIMASMREKFFTILLLYACVFSMYILETIDITIATRKIYFRHTEKKNMNGERVWHAYLWH